MLEAAIAAGVTAGGGDALLGGVLPTPAAPLLLRRHGLRGGGHLRLAQPLRGQRHQVFGADGFKLDDDTEDEIEAELERRLRSPSGSAACAACTARSRTTCARSTSASRSST